MLATSAASIDAEGTVRDVVVLVWPDQVGRSAQLEHAGIPRLWLVEPGADPPIGKSCLEDWLRLPAEDAEVRARLASLASRAARHPVRPTVDTHGRLKHRDAVVHLSPVEHQLAALLVAQLESSVSNEDLIQSAHLEGVESTLRVHVSRLRRRLASVGLTVTSVYGYGYVLRIEA